MGATIIADKTWYQDGIVSCIANQKTHHFLETDIYQVGSTSKKEIQNINDIVEKPAITKIAEQGNAEAQLNLAEMYYEGKKVKKDFNTSFFWYKKAAEQGIAEAQSRVGIMYLQGKGVELDYSKAKDWLQRAAKQGDAKAQNNLGIMYLQGNGVEQDYSKAKDWYQKAAEQGYVYSQANIGMMYFKGEGVEQNLDEAKKWLQKAAKQGYANAKDTLNDVLFDYHLMQKSACEPTVLSQYVLKKAQLEIIALDKYTLSALSRCIRNVSLRVQRSFNTTDATYQQLYKELNKHREAIANILIEVQSTLPPNDLIVTKISTNYIKLCDELIRLASILYHYQYDIKTSTNQTIRAAFDSAYGMGGNNYFYDKMINIQEKREEAQKYRPKIRKIIDCLMEKTERYKDNLNKLMSLSYVQQ